MARIDRVPFDRRERCETERYTVNVKTSWLIGSHPDCDLVVDDPHVSSRHCQLTRTAQGFQLTDLGSTNGTFVNGARLAAPAAVRPTDKITLGYSAAMPWPAPKAGGAVRRTAAEVIPPQARQIVVGRDADCDQVLDSTLVSRRHARFRYQGGQILLEDLASANGTYVNGRRVEGTVAVQVGDEISLGGFKMQLTQDGRLRMANIRSHLTIEARNLSVDVPGAVCWRMFR